MKVRDLFRISAWISSFLFLVASLVLGTYVLIRGAQAVTPPKIVPTEKKFLTAKGLLENAKDSADMKENAGDADESMDDAGAHPAPARIKEPTFRLPKEGVMLPKLASPGIAPGVAGGDFPMNTNGGGLSYTHTGMYGIFTLIEAVRQGRFHIYAVSTVDEGIEILTGVPAGTRGPDGNFPEGTVNRRVEDRLRLFAERSQRDHERDKEASDGAKSAPADHPADSGGA